MMNDHDDDYDYSTRTLSKKAKAIVNAMLCEKSVDEIVRNSHEEINKILQR